MKKWGCDRWVGVQELEIQEESFAIQFLTAYPPTQHVHQRKEQTKKIKANHLMSNPKYTKGQNKELGEETKNKEHWLLRRRLRLITS